MEFRAQISIFGFYYNRQLPSDQVIIRWLSKWSTLDKWMCAIFSLVFACSRHLFRNKHSNVCSVYSVIFRNTSIRIDIGFILSHLCVKLNFMHSLSYDTNDAHHWKSFVKWFYIYCSHTEACTPRMCFCVLIFFVHLLRSLSISRRMDHRSDVDAFDSVQHFDSKRFDSVCSVHTTSTKQTSRNHTNPAQMDGLLWNDLC